MSEQELQAHEDVLRADQSRRLEAEAVALVKQYGWGLPSAAKHFLRKVAAFMNWDELRGQLK